MFPHSPTPLQSGTRTPRSAAAILASGAIAFVLCSPPLGGTAGAAAAQPLGTHLTAPATATLAKNDGNIGPA
ncbi:MAG: hypothetical protein ACLP0L_25265 [Solirubrobacteraceae bacterium]